MHILMRVEVVSLPLLCESPQPCQLINPIRAQVRRPAMSGEQPVPRRFQLVLQAHPAIQTYCGLWTTPWRMLQYGLHQNTQVPFNKELILPDCGARRQLSWPLEDSAVCGLYFYHERIKLPRRRLRNTPFLVRLNAINRCSRHLTALSMMFHL